LVSGKLLLDVQQGKEAYSLMKAGILEGLSIGFYHLIASKRQGNARASQILKISRWIWWKFLWSPKGPTPRLV